MKLFIPTVEETLKIYSKFECSFSAVLGIIVLIDFLLAGIFYNSVEEEVTLKKTGGNENNSCLSEIQIISMSMQVKFVWYTAQRGN